MVRTFTVGLRIRHDNFGDTTAVEEALVVVKETVIKRGKNGRKKDEREKER